MTDGEALTRIEAVMGRHDLGLASRVIYAGIAATNGARWGWRVHAPGHPREAVEELERKGLIETYRGADGETYARVIG